MAKRMGVWIDHRRAVVVTLSDKGESIEEIRSEVEKQPHRQGGLNSTPSYGTQYAPADDTREAAFAGHLGIYFDRVIERLHDARSLLIFGPGEAKLELKKFLESRKLGESIVGLETADKMTDGQIAAKVRQRFQVPA